MCSSDLAPDHALVQPLGLLHGSAVLAAVYHDGGSVEKTKWLDESVVRSLPELAAQLKG